MFCSVLLCIVLYCYVKLCACFSGLIWFVCLRPISIFIKQPDEKRGKFADLEAEEVGGSGEEEDDDIDEADIFAPGFFNRLNIYCRHT